MSLEKDDIFDPPFVKIPSLISKKVKVCLLPFLKDTFFACSSVYLFFPNEKEFLVFPSLQFWFHPLIK